MVCSKLNQKLCREPAEWAHVHSVPNQIASWHIDPTVQHNKTPSVQHNMANWSEKCCYLLQLGYLVIKYARISKVKSLKTESICFITEQNYMLGICRKVFCFITEQNYMLSIRKVFCFSALLWTFHECGTEIVTAYTKLKLVTSYCSQQNYTVKVMI